jgi:flagellar motor switch/type III secretory pathway protein FliN
MNLKLTDDIANYNLINKLYNLLPEETTIELKDITGIDAVISISPAGREVNNIESAQDISFCLVWMPDNNAIYINIPDYFLCEFLGRISGVSISKLTPAGLALIEYILLKIIRRSNGEILSRLRWTGIVENKNGNNTLSLIFKANFMGGVYFLTVELNDKVAKELIKIMEKDEGVEQFSDISVNITPVLAEGEISSGELRMIQPGDIIAFKNPYIKLYDDGSKGGIIMFKTDNELIGGYDLDSKQFFYKNENRGDNNEQGKNSENLIQNIPVTLSIELMRIKVRMKDLSRLVPGQLLALKNRDPEDVLISANGKIIGTGRLVKIDGTVCVEVLTLNE